METIILIHFLKKGQRDDLCLILPGSNQWEIEKKNDASSLGDEALGLLRTVFFAGWIHKG